MKKFTKFLSLMIVLALSSAFVVGQSNLDEMKIALMKQQQENVASITHKGPVTAPEVIECPPGSILSVPVTNFANAYTSTADPAANYNAATPYTVSQSIGGLLRFWGLRMYFSGSWAECFVDPMEFEISFWDDNGGQPGTVQQSFTASITPTDIGEVFAGFPLWQWDVTMPITVTQLSGWMSIQATAANTNCWFLWVDAPDYAAMGTGLQWNAGTWGPLTSPAPLGFCFSAGGPANTNDVGVTTIVSPSTGANLGIETVEVTIMNFGTASQSNIPVSYTVNGGAAVNETFAGPLAGGAMANYTFTQTVDLSALGTYNFVACTNLAGDENTANDCKTKAVQNVPPALCAPTYSSGCTYGDGLTYFDIDGQYNNATACANNAGNGWSQYLGMNASLLAGLTYDVTASTGYSDQDLTIWIDFDNNYVLDASEIILDCWNLASAGVQYTTQVTIPAGAAPGGHQLRAMANWQPTDPCPYDPCGSFTYGETEDYMVTIVGANPGVLEGYVYEFGGTTPIAGATVDLLTWSATTNASGFYQIPDAPEGTWDVTASAPGYCDQTVTGVVIVAGNTTTQNFNLTWAEITTVPDPSVGFDELVGENQVFQTSLVLNNPGSCDLDYDIQLTPLTETFGGPDPGQNVEIIASGTPISVADAIDAGMPFTVNPNAVKAEATDGEEIFGSAQNTFGPLPRTRGNFFAVTTSTTLTEHRLWLNAAAVTNMMFCVWESPTQEGTYTMIDATDVSPQGPAGPGWFSSGSINVPLQAGYYYIIATAWDGNLNYYNEQNISPYPIPASFGTLFEACGWNWAPPIGYPPANTQTATGLLGDPVAYYQTIVTGAAFDWFWLDHYTGTVPAGGSETIPAFFSAVGYTQGTVKTALMEIFNNSATSPVTMDVVMTVGAPQVGNLEGYVYEYGGTTPVVGATVTIDDGVTGPQTTTTNAAGFYEFPGIYTGTYDVTVELAPFFPETGQVTILDGQTTTADWYLQWAEMDLNPTAVTVTIPPDTQTDRDITITNNGPHDLTYTTALAYLTEAIQNSYEWVKRPDMGPEFDASPMMKKGEFGTEAFGDILVEFNVSGPAVETQMLGGEFDGTYYWTTGGNSGTDPNKLYKWDAAGNLVATYDQPAAATGWGIRDLAYVGGMIYGGCEAGFFSFDPGATTWATVFSGNLGIGCIRALAYVPSENAFYTKSFSSNMIKFDMGGNILQTILDAATGASAAYGMAWDDLGGYLYIFDQSGTPATTFVEFDINTATATGTTIAVPLLTGSTDQIAGGAFWTTQAVSGKACLGGVTQGTPDDMLFCMEIADSENWVTVTANGAGTVAGYAEGALDLTLHFDATGYPEGTVKTAELTFTSDARYNPIQVVPITMNVMSGNQLDLKVYLEGPYNTGTGMMDTYLLSNGFVPLAQPFNPTLPYYGNNSPFWLYAGAEAVAAVPGGVVDWVMVEIRDAVDGASATGATVEEQFAAFLMEDGSIMDIDGTSLPVFTTDINDGLFVVIYQRNHAAVMNATPIPDAGGNLYMYDFTTAAGQAYLGGQKMLATGIYGMFGGEGNGDKQINSQDKLDVWAGEAGGSGYLGGDFNLDGQTNSQDKIDVWSTNAGQSSQVPN